MKRIIFFFGLLLCSLSSQAQLDTLFTLIAEWTSSTAVTDSTFTVTANHPFDQLGQGFLPTGIKVGYRCVDAYGRRYEVTAVNNTTFGTSTLTVKELQDQNLGPSGVGLVHRKPADSDRIPVPPGGNTGLAAATLARIHIHNVQNGGGAGGGSSEAIDINITDAGAHYTATEVENALQEVGDSIADLRTDLQAISSGASDGYAQSATYDGANEEIDVNMAAPANDFSIDVSALTNDTELADSTAAVRSDFPSVAGFATQSALLDTASAIRGDIPLNTDEQTLSFTSPNLSISNGNSVDLSDIDTDTQLSNEQVQDIAGGMVNGFVSDQTLINVTYDDLDGGFDFVVENDLNQYDNSTSDFATNSALQDTASAIRSDMLSGSFIEDVTDGATIDFTKIGSNISGEVIIDNSNGGITSGAQGIKFDANGANTYDPSSSPLVSSTLQQAVTEAGSNTFANATIINELRGDSMILVQDSILWTYTDGSITSIDTIRTPGGGGGGSPSGGASGDLDGTYPGPQVVGINDHPVSLASPQNGEALVSNGTSYQLIDIATQSELQDTAAAIRADFPVGGGGSVWTENGDTAVYNDFVRIGNAGLDDEYSLRVGATVDGSLAKGIFSSTQLYNGRGYPISLYSNDPSTSATEYTGNLYYNSNSTTNNWVKDIMIGAHGAGATIMGYRGFQFTDHTSNSPNADYVIGMTYNSINAEERLRLKSSGTLIVPGNSAYSALDEGYVINIGGNNVSTLTLGALIDLTDKGDRRGIPLNMLYNYSSTSLTGAIGGMTIGNENTTDGTYAAMMFSSPYSGFQQTYGYMATIFRNHTSGKGDYGFYLRDGGIIYERMKITAEGSVITPGNTTGNRPTGTFGEYYPNTTTNREEFHNGTQWQQRAWLSDLDPLEQDQVDTVVIYIQAQAFDASPTITDQYAGWRVPSTLDGGELVRVDYSFYTPGSGTVGVQMNEEDGSPINFSGVSIPVAGYTSAPAGRTLSEGVLYRPEVTTISGTGHEGLMVNLTITIPN
jgi:hypothetical protein